MRGIFSGNRASAPLGPPKGGTPPPESSVGSASGGRGETIQALRQRQREKLRQLSMQTLGLEKEQELAEQQGDASKIRVTEDRRQVVSEAADAIRGQILILERIMDEVGLTVDLEEDDRANQEALDDSREVYEQGVEEAEEQIREHMANTEYINTMASPFMVPSDVYDEDEAMRDLDECAKQTGRN